ncbi:MAG: gamma-glutamyltranspeptidase / glutathione hydrolase [Acidobacteriota bacterium]|jgi:gamma-glutamyltranspeptidase/glutathione hydrolase|nr:gamma-glutamyltranspeptidase / glutathione hydrolase [Acidobacteriota bacterium]
MRLRKRLFAVLLSVLLVVLSAPFQRVRGQRTQKPPLHGRHWMAITGKPLAATAGAMIFQKGGNAVDAACAMIAATSTMWDTLSWGGETQALIYNPHTGKVVGINALGVAPTGATADFYKGKGMKYPPEYGPLAAVTPGTPGGILTMLAEYGRLSLKDVLEPSIQMADGFPIEAQLANTIEREKKWLKQWRYSREVMLTHAGARREAPEPGEVFKQPDLAATLRKLVEAEATALAAGKSRKEAIYAAYERFYRGDIAQEIARGTKEEGGLITAQDLSDWKVRIEEPVKTNYKGVEVYKLTHWTQGPAMLQALNILENFDLKGMGYNSARYIHTIYQAMSMAFADRDFYYGDPYFPPEEPIAGLLSKDYAKQRAAQMNLQRNDPSVAPGDPYPFQGQQANPYRSLLEKWDALPTPAPNTPPPANQDTVRPPAQVSALQTSTSQTSTSQTSTLQASTSQTSPSPSSDEDFMRAFYSGTTSVEAADEEGWVVSVTPSGGWVPAVIAGHTGVGLSQRAQSFVTDPREGPFNVIEPGKHPRVTLTPTLALKDGKPYLAFAVQGGDSQDQNLLQFFLDIVEFGMTVQEATEAPNVNSFQMRSSFGAHETRPGRILLADAMPQWVRAELRRMGYDLTYEERTSGPINAILLDQAHGTMWGGSSNHGEDYGIAW